MKLSRIRLDQFQQFRTPLEVNDLGEGINLFAGPNESGKSTLVRAIRAAFFERHRSTSLSELQPWGDSSAAPEVTLAFAWRGQEWRLDKRFLRRQRCDMATRPSSAWPNCWATSFLGEGPAGPNTGAFPACFGSSRVPVRRCATRSVMPVSICSRRWPVVWARPLAR